MANWHQTAIIEGDTPLLSGVRQRIKKE